jgi:iron complex outermembrane receptor protein
MYTHSFREPSWREQYLVGSHYYNGKENLQVETVDAYELAYIKKFSRASNLKINLFYLKNYNQINAQNSERTFQNTKHNELYGTEAEYKTQFLPDDSFYLNYSYVNGQNTNGALANSTQNMAKAYYIYNLNNFISFSGTAKYIGEKERAVTDARENLKDYAIADLATTYKDTKNDFLISLSIKNLFDETYYLPAPENTYVNDFVQEGRSFLVRLSKRF